MFVSLIIDLCEIIGQQHEGSDDCYICSIRIPRNLVDIQDEEGQTNEKLTSKKVGLVSFSFHIPPSHSSNKLPKISTHPLQYYGQKNHAAY